MAMNVGFKKGLKATLPATRDANTFYYVTDEFALYLGEHLISNEVTLAQFNALEARVKTLEDWKAALPEYVTKSDYDAHITAQDSRDDDQDELIAGLRKDFDNLVAVGGEANKVNDVKVDGVSVVTDKVANIDLTAYAKSADVVAKSDYNTDMALKADKSELFKKTDADALYDAKDSAANALNEAKSYVDGKFTDANLDQYTTEQEVKNIVDEVISAAADVETTITGLTELVDYIEKHGGDASAMATDIGTLKGKVEVIEKKPAYEITSTQVTNWDAEVGTKAIVDANKATWDKAATALQAADLADYEKTADAESKIATAKGEAISEAANDAASKYVAKEGYVAYTQDEKDKLAGLENYNDSEVRGLIEAAKKAGDDAQADVDALELVVNNETTGLAAAHTKAQAGVDAAAAADAKAVTAQGEVDALELVVAQNAQTCQNNFNTIVEQLTWGEF